MHTRLIGALFAGTLLVAACGDDTDTSAPADDTPTESADREAPAADASGADVTIGDTAEGSVLTDPDGLSLYGFTEDVDGVPSCYDACADAWPPLIVEADFVVDSGLDPTVFSTVERTDGSLQLAAGKWPLYGFAGDAAPGDVNGQGSGDVWFLADADGSLVRGDEPAESSTPSTDGGNGY